MDYEIAMGNKESIKIDSIARITKLIEQFSDLEIS